MTIATYIAIPVANVYDLNATVKANIATVAGVSVTTSSWQDSWSLSLTTNANTQAGYTHRAVATAGEISTSGSTIRVTFAASTLKAIDIENASIVEQNGTTANGVTTPSQLFFNSGSNSVTIAANTVQVSDPLAFSFNEAKNYLIIVDQGDGNNGQRRLLSSGTEFFKAATNSYNTQNLAGATQQAARYFATKIEVEV